MIRLPIYANDGEISVEPAEDGFVGLTRNLTPAEARALSSMLLHYELLVAKLDVALDARRDAAFEFVGDDEDTITAALSSVRLVRDRLVGVDHDDERGAWLERRLVTVDGTPPRPPRRKIEEPAP